jgi:transposase, IS5 family
MKPSRTNHRQGRLFEQRLSDLLNPNHELCLLASMIKWEALETEFAPFFDNEEGRHAKPIRLIAGLMILQHVYRLSDEGVVARWVENPYWQLFCGFDYLQWKFPIHPTTLTKWRKKLGEDGTTKILTVIVETARTAGVVKKSSFKKVIVDTTVAYKAIAFPTDASLYLKSLKKLVAFARSEKISLRQTYDRLAPRVHRNANQLFHRRRHKQALKEVKKLKGYCGRVFREILRACEHDQDLQKRVKPIFFIVGQMLLCGQEEGIDKVYSLHEPHVECIAKGKAHKKYEFGCKASFVVTHREGFVIGAQAFHGNPYDGHTLQKALTQASDNSREKIEQAYVDKGYKGHGVTNCVVTCSGTKRHLNWRQWLNMKRRQAIEPHIGHMKSDGKLNRNHLHGKLGDKLHVLLCAIGHNVRLICNFLRRPSRPLRV